MFSAINAVDQRVFGRVYLVAKYDLLHRSLVKDVFTVFAKEDFSFAEQNINKIMEIKPNTESGNFLCWSNNSHIFPETLKEIQLFLEKYIDRFLFYAFLYEAEAKMALHDYNEALIRVAMAFENAVWLIMTDYLENKFKEKMNSLNEDEKNILEKRRDRLIDDFGRELGITLLSEIAPLLFCKETILQPSQIHKVQKALSMRNKLVHSKRTKKDEYFWNAAIFPQKQEHYYILYQASLQLGNYLKKIS